MMHDDPPPSLSHRHPKRLVAVIDTSVLVTFDKLQPILSAALDDYLIPIWSPCIVAEANRVLTWKWLRRQARLGGGSGREVVLTRALEVACSRDAKLWFDIMTNLFRVIDDRPPNERLWEEQPRDRWDIPIWNAAVRGEAHFVVTSNLIDGPPANADGLQVFEGIACVSPEVFSAILDWWSNAVINDEGWDHSANNVPPALREFLSEVLVRFEE